MPGVLLGLLGRRRARAVAALGLACAAGICALSQRLEAARVEVPATGFEVSVEARVGRTWRSAGGPQLELTAVRALDAHAPALPQRLWLSLDPESSASQLASGMRLRARLRIAPIAPLRNPGRPRDPRRLARRGIAARARLVHPAAWVGMAAGPLPGPGLAALRERLGRRLAAAGEGGALLRALGVGDPSALAPETREAFRSLGVAHLLAVSGLHLALVAGAVFALARRGLGRSVALAARIDPADPARALALLAGLAYALLCGFGVPVRRALVLVAALVASTLRERRAPRFHPIAAAAVLVLAAEPDALFLPGAQLSFAACTALVWGAARAEAGRLGNALHGSALAVAATAPLAAWHWGAAAPFAVLVNLVAIPWTALVLLPAALLATGLAAVPGPATTAAIAVLARTGAWSLAAGRALADALPASRGVEVDGMALLLALVLAALALWARSPAVGALLATGVGLLLRCAPPPAYLPPPPRLVVLDVGRGDALLVQGRRASVLVDGGAAAADRFDLGRSVVVPALRALGVARLDRVVATHADADHRGGLPAVLRALPVGALWLPHGGRSDPDFGELLDAARERGVPVREVGRGAPALRLGDLRVEPLWPPRELPRAASPPRNERSLALRIGLSGHRLLLLGDLGEAEAALVAAGGDLSADVLLLPHHGSGGSSSDALLRAVSPQLALVSAPCPARRGLPRRESLARARRVGASVWWTGRDGALFVGLGWPLRALPFATRRSCALPDQRSMPSTSRS